jgi:hypothetical protein
MTLIAPRLRIVLNKNDDTRPFANMSLNHLIGSEDVSLLLSIRLRLSNVLPPQVHLEDSLHITENLLIRRRTAALKISHDGRRLVNLCRELLLRHGRALVILDIHTRLLDCLADLGTDRLGLYNVIRAVNFCEVLAFW